MKIIFAIAAVLLLAACAPLDGGTLPVGYYEFQAAVEVREDAGQRCDDEITLAQGHVPSQHSAACAIWGHGHCRIIVPPNVSGTALRHELLGHCIKGDFHGCAPLKEGLFA